MPIIYRPRSPSFSDADSDLENVPPATSNADDSIVLSDLVRTGEASRLRRRGAMRLDHTHSGPNIHPLGPSPTVIVVGLPSWDSDTEDTVQAGPVYPRERLRTVRASRARRAVVDDELNYTYTIFCGAEDDGVDASPVNEPLPFEPSALPVYPSSSSRPPTLPSRRKRTNGCGAILHLSAAPRQRGTWLARNDPTDVVTPLDTSYFDKEAAPKIMKSACGCFREGIGCAVCGNPIGIRSGACKNAGDGTAHLRHKPSASASSPEGPGYWRASSNHHGNPPYSYTFFAHAVSSSPPHKFPPRTRAPESRPLHSAHDALTARDPDNYDNDGLQPTYNNTVFDRIITASPTPLSDDDDERESSYRNRSRTRNAPLISPLSIQNLRASSLLAAYDPDGELMEEPSSPDKTNDPNMLFPGR